MQAHISLLSWSSIHKTSFSPQIINDLTELECLHLAKFLQLSVMQHSSLWCPFINYEEKEVL
jgi:hypothetical protein